MWKEYSQKKDYQERGKQFNRCSQKQKVNIVLKEDLREENQIARAYSKCWTIEFENSYDIMPLAFYCARTHESEETNRHSRVLASVGS